MDSPILARWGARRKDKRPSLAAVSHPRLSGATTDGPITVDAMSLLLGQRQIRGSGQDERSDLAAGTHGVTLYHKRNPNRGIVQATLDGVTLSPTCDEHVYRERGHRRLVIV